ncbi:MAG: glutamine amidotransferase [Candidatus Saccharimonas sp.]
MKQITIVQLYPNDMNIYGDWGNTLTLLQRTKWHGYQPLLINYNVGDEFPTHPDIIVGGGGQDSGQAKISKDLLALGPTLKNLADNGTPMLMICGLYQQFGHFFKTKDGHTLPGIGVLDIETRAGNERLIGNIITESPDFGTIIGYENHSGLTTLGSNAAPLGTIIKGAGNNGQDSTEGARYKQVIGSYLHGSLLPKNPKIADYLISQACERAFGSFAPTHTIDDQFAHHARAVHSKRPR